MGAVVAGGMRRPQARNVRARVAALRRARGEGLTKTTEKRRRREGGTWRNWWRKKVRRSWGR